MEYMKFKIRGHEIAWVNPCPKILIDSEQRQQSFLLQTHEEPKVIKVKNYVKITFKTFFFDDEAISVYRGADNFEDIDRTKAVWKLISPDSQEYPPDAFRVIAKSDANNENIKTLFISHSFFKGGLHCGYSEERKCGESNFCWSRYQLTNNSFRVLCGTGLEWVQPEEAVIPLGAVVGGRENTGEELFVTKTEKNGAVFIGKVCATWMIVENAEKRLKCQYYDGKTEFTGDFEVLVWKE